MFIEDNFIMISALQHYVFCPRQCALIHIEDVWQENLYTTRGALLHEKVDSDTFETRGATKTVRGLRIHSYRLGITGRADVVEFRRPQSGGAAPEVVPVEFKAGKPKEDLSDKVQLCAQALCLEEMLNTKIWRGEFFYGRIRRRVAVEIGEELRKQTEEIIAAVHDLVSRGRVPVLDELIQQAGVSMARYLKKCQRCSLQEVCQPKAMSGRKLGPYIKGLYTP